MNDNSNNDETIRRFVNSSIKNIKAKKKTNENLKINLKNKSFKSNSNLS